MTIPQCGTEGFWVEYRLVMTQLQNTKVKINKDCMWYQGPFLPEQLKKYEETIESLEEKMKLLEAEHERWVQEQAKIRMSFITA